MAHFDKHPAASKFVVFIIGPLGGERDSPTPDDIAPISQHVENIREAADQALVACGLERGSFEVYVPTQLGGAGIIRNVFHKIDEADFALADISTRSPNVFYEIAFFNALGTPMIILDSSSEPLPFYWAQQRVERLRTFSVDEIRTVLEQRFKNYFDPDAPVDFSDNIISRFYDAALVDISAASGLAVGFYQNFARHILRQGFLGQRRKKTGWRRMIELRELVIIRPERISNLGADKRSVSRWLDQAKSVTVDAPGHPRGEVVVNVLEKAIIDFPAPLYALVKAPRYIKLRKRLADMEVTEGASTAAAARLEQKLIDAYFRVLRFLIQEDGDETSGSYRIVGIRDFAERGLSAA